MRNYFLKYLQNRKLSTTIGMVIDKLIHNKISKFEEISHLFKSKTGIEIGGPSKFFSEKGYLPIYTLAETVDGCNFGNMTVWEGHLEAGKNYAYAPGRCGYQYICEGSEVDNIPNCQYHFVLSCNSLEHIANPLKALYNWLKLIKDKGTIVLVLPRKNANFDHRRTISKFENILWDYKNDVKEDDLSHIEEILSLHDLNFDPEAGSKEDFTLRSLNNYQNRCLHHHVFDMQLLTEICNYLNLNIVKKVSLTANHIIIATK